MKVDTMRFIDRYFGQPICLLLQVLYWPVDYFQRRAKPVARKVMFVELSEMGSAVLVDPAMRWLEQQDKELYFVIFEKNACSLGLLGTVPKENIFILKPDSIWTLLSSTVRFLLWVRKQKINTVVDLELFSRFTAILTRLSGAEIRAGFHRVHEEGLYRGNFLTHPVMYNAHKHISRNFMTLVQATLSADHQPYQKVLSEQEPVLARAAVNKELREEVIQRLKQLTPVYQPGHSRLVLINPNASDLVPQRRWLRTSYAEVINGMLNQFDDVLVLITGSRSEQQGAEALRAMVKDQERCVNSAGAFSFEQLVPLYSISEMMLSNDSGPPHFASVTDLRTYVLFGPETPALYSSLGNSVPIYAGLPCSPCVSAANHRKTSCQDNQCLKQITADQVLDLVIPFLGRHSLIKGSA
ncbi:glycosyltransferase family 9 protein [Endozoicomonas sp. OPT23]|uniref:glycosyltransferase family 9 protein n=1 Tax=Endozoicomonas sp. OPT23 TaxID=2072845 RepID=UPI00129B70A1|nr:glycosyltransferase family 9 protein [Endozoicomonas sp. OPT23]MRI34820.1 glycosyltransferase family 9 protein [Endozoicomonas sp. OPT23]